MWRYNTSLHLFPLTAILFPIFTFLHLRFRFPSLSFLTCFPFCVMLLSFVFLFFVFLSPGDVPEERSEAKAEVWPPHKMRDVTSPILIVVVY